MSFYNNLKRAFGFGNTDREEEGDERLLSDSGDPSASFSEMPAPEADGSLAAEAPAIDPEAVKCIFASVVEVFNNSMPEFLKCSVNPEAQKEYLYKSLDQAMKDYLAKLIDDSRAFAEKEVKSRNHETVAELARLKQEKLSLEQQRSSIKEAQLSSDRRRRALNDRVNDLEKQVGSLEAEREQFELENKSLLNKLKLSEIQPGVVEELSAEVESLRAQLAGKTPVEAAAPELDGKALEAKVGQQLAERTKAFETRIAELEAALENRSEAARTSSEMFNAMQHELVEEKRARAEAAKAAETAREEAQAHEKALEEARAQLSEASEIVEGYSQLNEQMQQVEAAITKRDERIKSLQAKNRELKKRISQMERRLAGSSPSLPFDSVDDPEAEYGAEMITTEPIHPGDIADDIDLHGDAWLVSAPPQGTTIPSSLTEADFGYQEPPKKPRPKDADSQLSLF